MHEIRRLRGLRNLNETVPKQFSCKCGHSWLECVHVYEEVTCPECGKQLVDWGVDEEQVADGD